MPNTTQKLNHLLKEVWAAMAAKPADFYALADSWTSLNREICRFLETPGTCIYAHLPGRPAIKIEVAITSADLWLRHSSTRKYPSPVQSIYVPAIERFDTEPDTAAS
jgi:hypothetical protein